MRPLLSPPSSEEELQRCEGFVRDARAALAEVLDQVAALDGGGLSAEQFVDKISAALAARLALR
jgi:hypothetical protein